MAVTVLTGPDWPQRRTLARAAAGPSPRRVAAADVSPADVAAAANQPSLFGPPAALWLVAAEDASRDVLDAAADAGKTVTVVVEADTLAPALRAAVKRHRWQVHKCELPKPSAFARRAVQRARDDYPTVPASVAELVGVRCGADVAATESVLAAVAAAGAALSREAVFDLCATAAPTAAWNVSGREAATALFTGAVSAPAWLATRAAGGDPQLVAWLRASRSGTPVAVAAVAAALGVPAPAADSTRTAARG